MTYVSRKTRIIVSRWLDECDAEYRLRACRKRSDGRLKKYSSADDFRAWINDNCVKNEYLVDLMSNGEVSDQQPFKLYGRFIPVPVLFQILQNSKTKQEEKTMGKIKDARRCKSETARESTEQTERISIRAQWEKNQLEKNFQQCACLLDKALGKLENIDSIINPIDDSVRNPVKMSKEINETFYKTKGSCSCSVVSESSTISYEKTRRDTEKYAELLRKISDLREKLKKVHERRQEVNLQLRNSRRRAECASFFQLTELYSRQEEANARRLQCTLEGLISERGKLLYEMCQALTCLNNLKRSSRSNINRKKRNSTSKVIYKESLRRECPSDSEKCPCQCKNCDACEKSESGSSFYDAELKTGFEKPREEEDYFSFDCHTCGGSFGGSESRVRQTKPRRSNETTGSGKKKSKVKFACGKPCQKKLNADDLSDFESTFSEEQQSVISSILKSIEQTRPTTSPTTKREYDAATTNQKFSAQCSENTIDRRVKSETTMQDIEKTLRNYERRLSDLEEIDRKVEEMKEKTKSESECLKKNLQKAQTEAEMQRKTEREQSDREISRLSSENWELRKQVEQLTAKFNAQTKKMQSLKCGAKKARELEFKLECQAEELRKELSDYREGFERQRKCISKWESVVAVQRTEIENLMNHIRMLTKMKEESASNLTQSKQCGQRSRSFSPVANKRRGRPEKPKGGSFYHAAEKDSGSCRCESFQQPASNRTGQPQPRCCPGGPRVASREWCN